MQFPAGWHQIGCTSLELGRRRHEQTHKDGLCSKCSKQRNSRRLARRAKVTDDTLCETIARAEQGSINADLGNGLIKQRVARANEGRSGGFRTIVIYRPGRRAVFAYLFAKKDKENLTPVEEEVYRDLAKIVLELSDATLDKAVAEKGWKTIDYEAYEKKVSKRGASSGASRRARPSRTRRNR
jgi:hypothetical protein